MAACAIRVASTLGIRPASLRKGWLSSPQSAAFPAPRLAGFWDSFWPHSFWPIHFWGMALAAVQQCVSLIHYRISAPPEVEELLLGGLTEPTWLSPWLLSAEGEVVQDLSCV